MAEVRHPSEVAVAPRGDPVTLSFTADNGRELASLAGEALAKRRGNALRPGWRPVHTSGVFVSGSFTATGGAGPLAPTYLSPDGPPLRVLARFSSCDPRLPANDRRYGPRGLAVRLHLPDGETTDLVAMSTDRFMVSTRAAFIAASRAMRCRIPLRWIRLGWLRAVGQIRSAHPFVLAFTPRSYGELKYHTIHTFLWSTGKAKGEPSQPVRYRFSPAKPRRPMPWTRLFKHRQYLERELAARMRDGGMQFSLEVQRPLPDQVNAAKLADAAKPLRDIKWTAVGTLHLDRIVTGNEASELERVVFSPTRLVDGVDVYPGDEIMATRAAAYPASHLARAGGSP